MLMSHWSAINRNQSTPIVMRKLIP